LDCCEDLIKQRKGKTPISGILDKESNQSQLLLEKQRTLFYKTIEQAWNQLAIDSEISPSVLQQVSEESRNLAIQSREIVDRVYPYCGLYAANPETEINRVWRDLHTASQHSLLVGSIEK
jgi:small-conductance mechanosensitive channel